MPFYLPLKSKNKNPEGCEGDGHAPKKAAASDHVAWPRVWGLQALSSHVTNGLMGESGVRFQGCANFPGDPTLSTCQKDGLYVRQVGRAPGRPGPTARTGGVPQHWTQHEWEARVLCQAPGMQVERWAPTDTKRKAVI